jgi:hypothetical protein
MLLRGKKVSQVVSYGLKALGLSLVVMLSGMSSVFAHHSFTSTFSRNATVEVEGVVTAFNFRNPHVIIHLDATNDDGTVTNWMAEGASATGWRRSGWAADTLKPGDIMRIGGNASNDGSPMVWVREMAMLNTDGSMLADMTIIDTRGQPAEASDEEVAEVYTIPLTLPTGEPNFTGTTIQDFNIIPGGGRPSEPRFSYNAVGQPASDAYDPANDPQIFCDRPGLVRQGGSTAYGKKVAQYPDHVTIEYEEIGSKRAVFFGDELPKPGPRSNMGDSVARYEGDKLIIETVNLLPNPATRTGGPLSENARVTEVFSRADNPQFGSILKVDMTVVDPTYLTEPWTVTRYTLYAEDYVMIGNSCESPLRERPENAYQYTEFDLQFVN